jgi:hypothetical protein
MLLSEGTLVVFQDTRLHKVERAIRMIEQSPPALQRRQENLLAALKAERELLHGELMLSHQLARRRALEREDEADEQEAA